MEEPEVPLEECQKHIEEHAEHHGGPNWLSGVALSTAIFAAIAAVASLLAGQHINEAMISQIRASDQWGYYQAKGIKAGVLGAKIDLMRALPAGGASPAPAQIADLAADVKKFEHYAEEQEDISKDAKERETEADEHLKKHERLAFAVTLFQIAIAISAIAVLTKKPHFWWVGLAFGAGGIASLVIAHWPH